MAQVIGNLLQNAGKVTPRGGSGSLDVRRVGGMAELVVRDTGVGIDVAYDGPEAVARAREASYDVILCDLGLPTMT